MRIAFVQLGSFGDNINSTLMLPAIKRAYPDCVIDVHTTTLYQSAFKHNPFISQIIAHPCSSKTHCFDLYNTIPNEVKTQDYVKTFVPAPILCPDRTSLKHPELGNNLICSFMRALEEEGIEYDYPVKTTLKLDRDEIRNVDNWINMAQIQLVQHTTILMEVQGESGQSYWNHHWTLAVGRHLVARPYTNLIISRKDKTREVDQLEKEFPKRVYWAGALSIRECAELYNRCDHFISISSGLSNACNTDHCIPPDGDKRKWIEAVNSPTVTSAPLGTAGKTFFYENDTQKFIKLLRNRGL